MAEIHDEMLDGDVGTALICGMLGAVVSTLCGRERTRVDNLIIGGLFTGFAAYRDPRNSLEMTLLVAAIEGAIWGITDRTTPMLKDFLMPVEKAVTNE